MSTPNVDLAVLKALSEEDIAKIAREISQKVNECDFEGADGFERAGRGHMASVWSSSSVIFGALLSAYVGFRISAIKENFANAAMVFALCVLHSLFLHSINQVFVDIGFRIKKFSADWAAVGAVSAAIASFIWVILFGSYLFYSAIIAGWVVVHFGMYRLVLAALRETRFKANKMTDPKQLKAVIEAMLMDKVK